MTTEASFSQYHATRPYGRWLVLAAATLWGTTGTAQALAPMGASVQALGAFRLLFGAIVLLLVAWQAGAFIQREGWNLRALFIGGVMIALYQLLFFAGVGRAGVAIGTIVGIGSAPIIAGVLDYVIEKQVPGRRWLVATLLALVGCVLLVLSGGDVNSVGVDVLGLLMAVGAGASYAVYTLASKHAIATQNSDGVMAVIFTLGALILSPLLLTVDLGWIIEPGGVLVVLWLGVMATGFSYVLFGRGLRSVNASTAVSLTLAEPMTAGILGVLLVGERPSILAGVGLLLLFAGLAVLTLGRVKQ